MFLCRSHGTTPVPPPPHARARLALDIVLEVSCLKEGTRKKIAGGKQVGEELQRRGQLWKALAGGVLAQPLWRGGTVLVAAGGAWQGFYKRSASGM